MPLNWTIAEAYVNNQSGGLKLVSEGYAVVYVHYLDSCAETESEYLAVEEQAKERRLNDWSQDAKVMPWEFRRIKKRGARGLRSLAIR